MTSLNTKGNPPFNQPLIVDPVIKPLVEALIAEIREDNPTFSHGDVIYEIIHTAIKAAQSHIGRGDMKLLSRTIRELRYAFKIFNGYKDKRKITIFGSARTKPNHPEYKLAKNFAAALQKKGFMVITGAGPGIMEAGNLGAGAEHSFGVNIRLPFEQFPNKYIAHQPTYIDCRYFFTRKLVFVRQANAVAYFPGGFGTLDEAFEVLTLIQTGKADPMPIVMMDIPGGHFWKNMMKFIHSDLLKTQKISKEDLSLFKITTSVKEAVEEVTGFYRNYHSLRYVGELLVFRLQKPVSDLHLKYINTHFKDILTGDEFVRGEALDEEENQPELAALPRLIFKFNRTNNGRLRQLIDYLNKK